MAFPDTIVEFPEMLNINEQDGDGEKIDQFHQAIRNGNMAEANAILHTIVNYNQKIVTADYLNSIGTTCNALETYYLQRYSPAYIISSTQPISQNKTDFWFQITGSA